MAVAKVWVNGSWVDICSVVYNIYEAGQFEDLHTRPFTFYDEAGTGYQFQCIVAPQAATVSVSNVTSTSIEYSIDMPDYTNVDTLEFYLDGVKTGEIAPPTGNPVIHTESPLSEDTSYDFYVISINAAGSTQSNTVTQTTSEPVPAAPTLVKDSEGPDSVTLSWNEPQYADTYDLYRDSSLLASNLTSVDIPYTDSPPSESDAGVSYGYYVVAKNATGSSPDSNSVTYINYTPPGTPGAPLVALESNSPQNNIVVGWDAPTSGGPIDNYQVERRLGAGGTWFQIATPVTTTYTDTSGINDGQDVYYRIRAVGPGGIGNYSPEGSITYQSS